MGKKSATLCHLGSKLDLFLYRHLIKRVPFRLLNCGNKLPWQQIWFLMSSDQIKLLLKYQNDRPEKYGVYSCVTIKKSRIWSANYYKSHRWLKYIYIYIYILLGLVTPKQGLNQAWFSNWQEKWEKVVPRKRWCWIMNSNMVKPSKYDHNIHLL